MENGRAISLESVPIRQQALMIKYTVKPVLVATSIKHTTCIKQDPRKCHILKCTFIKQAYFDYPSDVCVIQVGLLCMSV